MCVDKSINGRYKHVCVMAGLFPRYQSIVNTTQKTEALSLHKCSVLAGPTSTYRFDFPLPPNTHTHAHTHTHTLSSTTSPLPTLSHSVSVRKLLPSANRLLPLHWMIFSLRSEQPHKPNHLEGKPEGWCLVPRPHPSHPVGSVVWGRDYGAVGLATATPLNP